MAWGNTRVVNSEKVALTFEEKEIDRQRRAEIERNRKQKEERAQEQRKRQQEKAEQERRQREYEGHLQGVVSEVQAEYKTYGIATWVIGGIIIALCFMNESAWGFGVFIVTAFIQGLISDSRDKKISEATQRLQARYGIKSKGFCYITTAICELEGKEDDCYELTAFRQFRDEYLLAQSEGKILVEKYYKTAPNIIASIDKQFQDPQKEAIYRGVREKYLKPCLSLIEIKEFNKCKETYIQMVEELERYII